ncbi:hypothetical protein CEUSTIGMA_g11287.t1 [Chlamydomonas eustigma]|uniref:ubiquitinyl hydrolase 1 n=1 Tax=Chlamydomonas eustigma TaxID=1157962 RepID=A0A250XLU0_9CHLO|nr:hypothetical protein CEUSTIGMA_g11287.t1 [Chlamydomonas eustigma]|eukprot:GAX83862.1 hypothetical protein CEUSTIGMA_g11287.t1 [Chlamydomonas eustigma]
MSNNKLYHEKQVAALCGVHCINTLLQGPIFSEVDLAQIGLELDEMERRFMQEGGVMSEEYQKFAAEGSGNVAADGMFSIQVLQKALEVWNLQVIPFDHPEVKAAKQEPQSENAFICNLQEHWFTIRKMEGEWWNFNSLFPAPQLLGAFYLSAFLTSLREQGYQILVVRGALPQPQHPPSPRQIPPSASSGDDHGRWFTAEEAKVANEEATEARHRGKVANVMENMLSRAAAQGGSLQLRSKRDRQGGFLGEPGLPSADDYDDADMAAAIAASLAGGDTPAGTSSMLHVPQGGSSSGTVAGHGAVLDSDLMAGDEEQDLAAAIAASLGDLPGPSTSTLQAEGAHVGVKSVIPGLPIAFRQQNDSDGNDSTEAVAGGDDASPHHHSHPFKTAAQNSPTSRSAILHDAVDAMGEEDEQLAAAIAASLADQLLAQQVPNMQSSLQPEMEEEPLPGPGVVELAFRLPNAQRLSHRFKVESYSEQLYSFASKMTSLPAHKITISTSFPRKDLPNSGSESLLKLGVGEPQVLVVTGKI